MTCNDTYARIVQMANGDSLNRTPCFLFLNFPFISSVTGVTHREYFYDPKSMLDAQIETYRRVGTNGPLWPDFGTVCEPSALGGEIEFDNAGIPSIRADPDSTIEDLAELKPADPRKDGWMPRHLAFLEYFKTHKPADFRVTTGNIMAPFTTAALLRGLGDFCVDLLEEPELSERFLTTCTDTIIAFYKEQEKILGKDFDRIFLSDDVSSMISAVQFEVFVSPTYEKIFSTFPNVMRWLHNDGRATHVAAQIAKTGIQIWHIGKTEDAKEILKLTGGNVAICGNLDPLEELMKGTPEQVLLRARKEISDLQFSGKHILSSGGFIGFGTPIDNVKALLKASSELQ